MADRDENGGSARHGGFGAAVSELADHILSVPVVWRVLIALALVAVVAALDAATGSEISFSVFYLVPVAFAGAFVSRRAGWAMAAVSTAVWVYLDVTTGPGHSAAWIYAWNAGVRISFFLVVNELVTMLRAVQAHLNELSRTDSLTGLANGRVFQEHAEQVIARSRRNGNPFTIAYVDLDRFKQVNDEFGHSEGDLLLRSVSAHIKDGLRSTDVVARLGGDEFGILMPDTGMEEAAKSLQRVARAIDGDVECRGTVGATFGAVTFDAPPDDVDAAVRRADALMYRGKAQGRGRILQSRWPEREGREPEFATAREAAAAD